MTERTERYKHAGATLIVLKLHLLNLVVSQPLAWPMSDLKLRSPNLDLRMRHLSDATSELGLVDMSCGLT